MEIENSRILIREDELKQLVRALGQRITADYRDRRRPLLLCLLDGALPFYADLVRAIDLDVEMGFIKVSSYGSREVSSGRVDIQGLERLEIRGRHVIVVDELIDTGITLDDLRQALLKLEPASVEFCTCLSKPQRRIRMIDVKYLGMEVENVFLIGYGMDRAGHYRNLPYVAYIDTKESEGNTV